MNCRGPCDQGDRPCPHPDLCAHQLADWKATRAVFVAIFAPIALACLVGLLSWALVSFSVWWW